MSQIIPAYPWRPARADLFERRLRGVIVLGECGEEQADVGVSGVRLGLLRPRGRGRRTEGRGQDGGEADPDHDGDGDGRSLHGHPSPGARASGISVTATVVRFMATPGGCRVSRRGDGAAGRPFARVM